MAQKHCTFRNLAKHLEQLRLFPARRMLVDDGAAGTVKDAAGHLRLGRMHYAAYDFESARREFSLVLECDPGNLDARLARGACSAYLCALAGTDDGREELRREALTDLASAKAALLRMNKQCNENPETHANLGRTYYCLALVNTDAGRARGFCNCAAAELLVAAKEGAIDKKPVYYSELAAVHHLWEVCEFALARLARKIGDDDAAALHAVQVARHRILQMQYAEEAREAEREFARQN